MNLANKVLTAIRVFRVFGPIEMFKLTYRKSKFWKETIPKVSRPSGVEILSSDDWSDEFFARILGAKESEVSLARREFSLYKNSFDIKVNSPRSQYFGAIFDLGPRMSEFLFTAILILRPKKIIETGVAAGVSTNTILSALNINGVGNLYSLDITEHVGELVDEQLKGLWQLKILPEMGREKAFSRSLSLNQDATIFIHDSDHSSSWQIKELVNVVRELPKIELILFDDIGQELIDFIHVNLKNYQITVFDEHSKFSGVVYSTRNHVAI